VKSWFGYKLHLVVDATYELPVNQYCAEKIKKIAEPEGLKKTTGRDDKKEG